MNLITDQKGAEMDRSSNLLPDVDKKELAASAYVPDCRPGTVEQRKLNAEIENSAPARALEELETSINQSPKVLTQAKFADQLNGPVLQREMATYEEIEDAAHEKSFNWRDFKTKMNKASPQKAAKAKGRGVETTEDTELQTKIKWGAVHGPSGEATSMDATVLGPDHQLGSEPTKGKNKVWNKRRDTLVKASGKKYIAGHLLNNNLGGPGNDARNLTAIPATANTTQSARIEEEVKNIVNNHYKFVRYKVDISYTKDNAGKKEWYASTINSLWHALDKDGQKTGAVKRATIQIPSPTQLGGGTEIDIQANDAVLDLDHAAEADINPETDVVLNNSGFLAVATVVQRQFTHSIATLNKKLGQAQDRKVETEEERDSAVYEMQGMQEDLDEATEAMQKLQEEVDGKMRLLAESETEVSSLQEANQELSVRLGKVMEQAEKAQEEVELVKRELEKALRIVETLKFKKKKLKKEKKRLVKENASLTEKNRKLTDQNNDLQNDLDHEQDLSLAIAASYGAFVDHTTIVPDPDYSAQNTANALGDMMYRARKQMDLARAQTNMLIYQMAQSNIFIQNQPQQNDNDNDDTKTENKDDL